MIHGPRPTPSFTHLAMDWNGIGMNGGSIWISTHGHVGLGRWLGLPCVAPSPGRASTAGRGLQPAAPRTEISALLGPPAIGAL